MYHFKVFAHGRKGRQKRLRAVPRNQLKHLSKKHGLARGTAYFLTVHLCAPKKRIIDLYMDGTGEIRLRKTTVEGLALEDGMDVEIDRIDAVVPVPPVGVTAQHDVQIAPDMSPVEAVFSDLGKLRAKYLGLASESLPGVDAAGIYRVYARCSTDNDDLVAYLPLLPDGMVASGPEPFLVRMRWEGSCYYGHIRRAGPDDDAMPLQAYGGDDELELTTELLSAPIRKGMRFNVLDSDDKYFFEVLDLRRTADGA